MGLAVELQASRDQAVASGNVARGIFAELWDADGQRYIDFAASLIVPTDQLDEILDTPDDSIEDAINVKGA